MDPSDRSSVAFLETPPGESVLALPEDLHWHARPLTLIARVVEHHGAAVTARIGEASAAANSVMELLLLVAAGAASSRRVAFTGPRTCLRDLETLFRARLGEDGLDQLPDALDYLRSA